MFCDLSLTLVLWKAVRRECNEWVEGTVAHEPRVTYYEGHPESKKPQRIFKYVYFPKKYNLSAIFLYSFHNCSGTHQTS